MGVSSGECPSEEGWVGVSCAVAGLRSRALIGASVAEDCLEDSKADVLGAFFTCCSSAVPSVSEVDRTALGEGLGYDVSRFEVEIGGANTLSGRYMSFDPSNPVVSYIEWCGA
jgi:hypothetical protein